MAYLEFGKGGHGERAEHEPITGIWGRSPQRVQGQSPWSESLGGEPPWSWNTFCFWTFNESRKFAHFFWSLLKNGKKRTFSYKVACKKIHGRAKGGRGIAPCPPKYATVNRPKVHDIVVDARHRKVVPNVDKWCKRTWVLLTTCVHDVVSVFNPLTH